MSKIQALSRVNTVLFDLDGTLMDSNDLIVESWQYTVKSLTGREISAEEVYTTFGEMLIDSMRRLLPEVDAELARDFFRDYQRGIFLERIKLFDGAEEVLGKLKDAGFKLAIVTSRLKTSAERGLAHLEIAGFFDAVLTASDTDKFKPDPAPIFMILDMVGSKPEEAIFIGDSKQDIEAGAYAGVLTALVDWSIALPPEKRMEEPVPDFVISSLLEILDLLGLCGY